MKKFINGLLFGCGFGLALILILYVFTSLDVEHKTYSPSQTPSVSNVEQLSFRNLSVDEQIELSSVIVLIKYKQSATGEVKLIISEILKKDINTEFPYSVGDEYKYVYPKDTFNGDGEVIFFTGTPAKLKRSISYYGERIHGLGNIPVELLRKKCNTIEAHNKSLNRTRYANASHAR